MDSEEEAAIEAAYQAGVDSVKDNPNGANCHFMHFATKARCEAWQRGSDETIKQEEEQTKRSKQ